MLSKSGNLAFDAPRWIIDFSITFVLAIFIFIVLFNFINENIPIHDIEADNVMKNLLYSDYCLVYSDEFGSYPGIVDLNKLSKENLISCFAKDGLGYTVSVLDAEGNELKSIDPEFNYNMFIPICKGNKDFVCSEKKDFVLYMKDGKKYPGIINVEVIT